MLLVFILISNDAVVFQSR